MTIMKYLRPGLQAKGWLIAFALIGGSILAATITDIVQYGWYGGNIFGLIFVPGILALHFIIQYRAIVAHNKRVRPEQRLPLE